MPWFCRVSLYVVPYEKMKMPSFSPLMMSYIENERETFPQPTEPRACRHLELFGSSCTYYVRKTEQEFGTKPTNHLKI